MAANSVAISGLVFLLIFILSYYIVKIKRNPRATAINLKAPEAYGRWPLLGHLPLLRGSKPAFITLGQLADKYGPIFTIYIGTHKGLVISNGDLVRECFSDKSDVALSDRPETIAQRLLGYNSAMLAFSPYGPYWREIRKIIIIELLSNRRVDMLRKVRESEVEVNVKKLYTKSKLELSEWFEEVNMNLILRIVAGKRFSFEENDRDREGEKCKRAITDFFDLIGTYMMGDLADGLGWVDNVVARKKKAMKKAAMEMDRILNQWLEEHKVKKSYCNPQEEEEEDFMDAMLRVLDGNSYGGFDADTITKATTSSMIIGGSDTSAVTLTWAISLLLNNLDTLKKVRNELDRHVGNERLVKEIDINKLVYLQAVIKETLRLYPVVSVLPRKFTKDCSIGGYHVSKDSWLFINVWKIHTDPETWSDPLEFKPERFLTSSKDGNKLAGIQNCNFIPFGGGRRICPGSNLGLQMVHLTLASLLHAFDISSVSANKPVSLIPSNESTNKNSEPVEVLIKPRLSHHHLYE